MDLALCGPAAPVAAVSLVGGNPAWVMEAEEDDEAVVVALVGFLDGRTAFKSPRRSPAAPVAAGATPRLYRPARAVGDWDLCIVRVRQLVVERAAI